ncbi:MAG TPA: DUF1343 domain-containing protein [Gemmatimonadaceae bacterium]|nr:DUF1343 domain-containing protein [Gemmatimonadaceae bacterium]
MKDQVHGMQGLSVLMLLAATALSSCAQAAPVAERQAVRPGITVLIEDSLALVAGRRIALLTNQTGVDAAGVSDVELLMGDRASEAGVTLVRLFSPEHGIRGTIDTENVPDVVDERSGLMVHSLYRLGTVPPPDSLLADLDALVFDLQDIGTRTWTYVGVMIYAMRAAERAGIPFIVLDRPNPLGGSAQGPLLDSSLANALDPAPGRRGQAYALYPTPLRHGMTMGEMARFFAATLDIAADLHVVPMHGWDRSMWWDETGLPWIVPSPAMVSPVSALFYPTLVAFEATNVSVARGTPLPFQQFGAPWLDAARVADMLNARSLAGVRFEALRFTPGAPTDGKYGGESIPGVRMIATDRDSIAVGRIGASILWAIAQTHGDSLRITERAFDLRFGSPEARAALVRGDDPAVVIDRAQSQVDAYWRRVQPYLLYR